MPRPPRGASLVLVFPVAAVLLFLLNAQHSYNPTDDGFILALSWRVLNGEIPYRDFLYIRAPLTPYLHTIELMMPDGWAIIAGRAAYYLELAISGALPTAWVASRLGVRASATGVALVAAIFFVSLHNFPPMPWATVDGVLFASIGATAFLESTRAVGRRQLVLVGAASIALVGAGLAKQSFFALSILLVAYTAVRSVRARTWSPAVAAVLPAAVAISTVAAAFWNAGALGPFARSMVEPAQLRPTADMPWSGDLLEVAVLPYLRALDPGVLVAMAGAFAAARWPGRGPYRGGLSVLLALAGIAAVAFQLPFNIYRAGLQLFWVLVAIAAGWLTRRDGREDVTAATALAAILAVAWCASLSFAYQTPLLGLAAGGVFFERLVARVAWPRTTFTVTLAATLAIALVFWLNVQRPYRDVPRDEQTADLATIYARAGHLFTNPANLERFRELRELSMRYAIAADRPFIVAPDFPLVHYLSGVPSPLSLDWIQPQEYVGHEQRLSGELSSSRPVVIIQREPSATVGAARDPLPPCDRPPDRQFLVDQVLAHGRLIAESRSFCVWDP